MKLHIDADACTGHGRCYVLAPEVFEPDDEGHSVGLVDEIPADLLDKDGADDDADTVGGQQYEEGECHRDVEAVCKPYEHIAAPVVGAEWMLPGRRVRWKAGQVQKRFVRAVRVGRHQYPVA